MGTQGLVTVMQGGKVVAKLTAGDNGFNARDLAIGLVKHLRAADPDLLLFLMEHHEFGCEACRVVAYRAYDGSVMIRANYDASHTFQDAHVGYDPWVTTFDKIAFNPRWERGTADYCVVADLDAKTVRRAEYVKGRVKWLGEADVVS